MSGGQRAAAKEREEQLVQLNRAAMKVHRMRRQSLSKYTNAKGQMGMLSELVCCASAGLAKRKLCSRK